MLQSVDKNYITFIPCSYSSCSIIQMGEGTANRYDFIIQTVLHSFSVFRHFLYAFNKQLVLISTDFQLISCAV